MPIPDFSKPWRCYSIKAQPGSTTYYFCQPHQPDALVTLELVSFDPYGDEDLNTTDLYNFESHEVACPSDEVLFA